MSAVNDQLPPTNCADLTMLQFDRLYAAALSEWPERLDFKVRQMKDAYLVEGLAKLQQAIAEKWVGHPQEVLMSNLHWAIMSVAHAAFANGKAVMVDRLDRAAVRLKFEADLRRVLTGARSWGPADILLVRSYFTEN